MSWNKKATADALMKAPVMQFATAPADAVPTVHISSEFYRDFKDSGGAAAVKLPSGKEMVIDLDTIESVKH